MEKEMNKNPKVDECMSKLEHSFKVTWEEIREIVLSVNPRMEEDIKWGAPTFLYKGNLAIFNPRAKKFVNLTFHTGAMIDDPEGILEGDAKEAKGFRENSSEELGGRRVGFEKVVRSWIDLKNKQLDLPIQAFYHTHQRGYEPLIQ
jgi:hypothetical protein